jgi:hypothetical protein
MHLPQAYRSLPRPSSLIKPSHPPTGVFAPVSRVYSYIYEALNLYANTGKDNLLYYHIYASVVIDKLYI